MRLSFYAAEFSSSAMELITLGTCLNLKPATNSIWIFFAILI